MYVETVLTKYLRIDIIMKGYLVYCVTLNIEKEASKLQREMSLPLVNV
jgi:hypothetical protein